MRSVCGPVSAYDAGDAVSTNDTDIPIGANVDGAVQTREVIRINGGNEHTAKRSVRVLNAARDLNRPLSRRAADDRPADEEVIIFPLGKGAKMQAVPEINPVVCLGFDAAQLQEAIRADDRQLHDLVIGKQAAVNPIPEIESVRVEHVAPAHDLERPVDIPRERDRCPPRARARFVEFWMTARSAAARSTSRWKVRLAPEPGQS